MTLAQEAAAGPPVVATGNRRRIDIWLDTLKPADRAAATAVLDDPNWSHSAIQTLFRRHGLQLSQVQIGRYRKDRADEPR